MTDWDLGVWSIEQTVVDWIVAHVPKRARILEFGSGEGTGALAEVGFEMTSVEQNPNFLDKYQSSYIYAPINRDWYSVAAVEKGVHGKTFDLILVDGPVETKTTNRSGFIRNFHLFQRDIPIVFDDTHRPGDMKLARDVCFLIGGARLEAIGCANKQAHALVIGGQADVKAAANTALGGRRNIGTDTRCATKSTRATVTITRTPPAGKLRPMSSSDIFG